MQRIEFTGFEACKIRVDGEFGSILRWCEDERKWQSTELWE
jgi:hypothetical protein